jgi:hypothetical protein
MALKLSEILNFCPKFDFINKPKVYLNALYAHDHYFLEKNIKILIFEKIRFFPTPTNLSQLS